MKNLFTSIVAPAVFLIPNSTAAQKNTAEHTKQIANNFFYDPNGLEPEKGGNPSYYVNPSNQDTIRVWYDPQWKLVYTSQANWSVTEESPGVRVFQDLKATQPKEQSTFPSKDTLQSPLTPEEAQPYVQHGKHGGRTFLYPYSKWFPIWMEIENISEYPIKLNNGKLLKPRKIIVIWSKDHKKVVRWEDWILYYELLRYKPYDLFGAIWYRKN